MQGSGEIQSYQWLNKTQLYYLTLLEVRNLTWASQVKDSVGRTGFLSEAPGEDLFSGVFQLVEAAVFLGLWPLTVFKTNNEWQSFPHIASLTLTLLPCFFIWMIWDRGRQTH